MVDTYGRDYMILGAGEIQKRLAADLVVLQQQLDTPCLWAVGAKLATLYGKTFPGSNGVKAHVAAIRGDVNTAMGLLGEGRRVFDAAGSDDTESYYAVPWWRFNVFISLMAARLGAEHLGPPGSGRGGPNPAGVAAPIPYSPGDAPGPDARPRRRPRRRNGLRPSSTRHTTGRETLPDASDADDGDRSRLMLE